VQHACRSMSPTLDRGLTTPSGRVHSLRGANRPGPCGVPSSHRQICSRSRCASLPRPSDRAATARFRPRFMVLSSNRTTPQVDQATHTEAFADFVQRLATGREESAQQPIPSQLLDLDLPALGATAQPLENPGQLRRDRSLSFAEKPGIRGHHTRNPGSPYSTRGAALRMVSPESMGIIYGVPGISRRMPRSHFGLLITLYRPRSAGQAL
jgi:hypothetical protein